MKGLYTELVLELSYYINDSRQKNALSYYNEFKIKKYSHSDTIKSYFVIILAHHWNFIDKKDLMYNIIEYLGIE
nr:hypothetical protein 1 [Moraxellaceae bacterium]